MEPVLDNAQSLAFVLPELLVTAGAAAVLVLDLLLRQHRRRVWWVVCTALMVLGAAAWATWRMGAEQVPVALFHGLIVWDPWAVFFKYFAWSATALAIIIAVPSLEVPRERLGEYCALLLAIAVGLSLMASAIDMLMMVIGVELVSMVSYALAGFRQRDRRAAEAALKYVVYGGVASGLMLFGMSYLYGLLGTTNIVEAGNAVALEAGTFSPTAKLALLVASVLVLAGVGYKIAAVPWHMWCPDVYEGAPTPFTAFLSVGPKAAGFALAVRLFYGAFSRSHGAELATAVGGLPWPEIIGVMAAVSMTLGNLAALQQTNLKRMLAYSSIAHAGYLLLGVGAASATGSESVLIYLVVYLLMNLGAFLVVGAVARVSGSEVLHEYRGLSVRAPLAAVALAIFLFSLTGLPPLAGFVGKFHLFRALMERGQPWYVGLALLGLINSAVSLYYYARVVRAMFLQAPEVKTPIAIPTSYRFLLGGLLMGVVGLGLYVDGLRKLAAGSVRLFGHS